MIRKGSITIFLTLVLSLLIALVCSSIESARMAAARSQILNSLDIGLYSLFGQYDKTLLEKYDVFLLDASCGGGNLKMATIYNHMESYIKPLLQQNSQKLSLVQGGFTGYRLATDEEGEVFYQQVVDYMRETLGIQGVQRLLENMQERERQTKEAERTGKDAEENHSLEVYQAEMDVAAQKSQAAREQLEAQQNSQEANGTFSDGNGSSASQGSVNLPEAPTVNPITEIQKVKKMGILDLVIPASQQLSGGTVERSHILSGRTLQKGMGLSGTIQKDTSYTSGILFQQYLMDKLGNYRSPASGALQYQIEYLFSGKNSDLENLKAVASRLLLIREGINFAHLLSDSTKRMQAEALAAAIAAAFLVPPATVIIEGALLLCWSFAESILDVRGLFAGGKVPLVKSAATWQLSLEKLPYLLSGLDSERKNAENGVSYEDYLQILLMMQNRQQKLSRGMDMVELSVRSEEGKENFCLDSCITELEAVIDVKANEKKTFTVVRAYAYE